MQLGSWIGDAFLYLRKASRVLFLMAPKAKSAGFNSSLSAVMNVHDHMNGS
jgi:hypothetical protein